MDINTICLSGHVYDVKILPTSGIYPVVEARLSVHTGTDENGENMFCDFLIRSYGKKNTKVASMRDGDFVTVHGKLKRSKAETGSSPLSGRAYISVDTLKFLERS